MTNPAASPDVSDERVIHVCGLIARRDDGAVLQVRKRGSGKFQFPGGKPEAGETEDQTILRECAEEIGCTPDRSRMVRLGSLAARAANEPGFTVRGELWLTDEVLEARPDSEIAEARWLTPADREGLELAQLSRTALAGLERLRACGTATVYAGSAEGVDPRGRALAAGLGAGLARAGVEVAYGGGAVGLMGVLGDAVVEHGGRLRGIMPDSMIDAEIAHPRLSELTRTPDMAARKAALREAAGVVFVLPGGSGTLDEFFETWTLQQLGHFPYPIVLLGTAYWTPLVDYLRTVVGAGFLLGRYLERLIVADDLASAGAALAQWETPASKYPR